MSQIESDEPLSQYALGYLTARARNNFYDYVLTKFQEAQERGLTKAQLADRLGLGRDRISKLLGAPGNWTIDTVAELLVGICREELIPHSAPFAGRPPRNMKAIDDLIMLPPTESGGISSVAKSANRAVSETETPVARAVTVRIRQQQDA